MTGRYILYISFFLAHGLYLIPTSDQNTYLLHGLGLSIPSLSNDWLFNTIDPYPLFTLLIFFLGKIPYDIGFYTASFCLSVVAFVSLMKITDVTNERYFIVGFFIILLSSVFTNYIIPVKGLFGGLSRGGIVDSGLFLPSSFGILLITSIYYFVKEEYYKASILSCVASIFHASYFPYSAMLTAMYMSYVLFYRKNVLLSLKIGGLSLLIVLPYVLYLTNNMLATNESTAAIRASILHDFRFPHHSNINVWFDKFSILQILIMVCGCLISKGRLKYILSCSLFILILILTLSIFYFDKSILLHSPWRFSVITIPISSALLINFIISNFKKCKILEYFFIKKENIISYIMLSVFILANLYMLKVQIFKLNERATIIEQLHAGVSLIPLGWQNFRIESKKPVVVDFKSHPYKDIELIEWKYRLDRVRAFYQDPTCTELKKIATDYEVKNVILKENLDCNFLENRYVSDKIYLYEYSS